MNGFLRRMLMVVLGRQLIAFILRRRPNILSYGRQVVLLALSAATSILIGWLLVERNQTGRIQMTLKSPVNPQRLLPAPTDDTVLMDDLTIIDGIGKAYARVLNELGVRTFAELAQRDPGDIARQSRGRISAERIRHQDWIGQARQLSRA